MGKKPKRNQPESSDDANQKPPAESVSRADQEDGREGLGASRPYIVRLFARLERINEKIDEAFAARPFLPHLPPDDPANRRRCRAYQELLGEGAKLLLRAQELWMTSYGFQVRRGSNSRGGRANETRRV